ncbi:MAG: glycosyltransferase family 2 protein [Anaerolineae bacterium]|nr:glycosyltransferase family 2 protein [Anaerolineae bacterium]
MPPATSQQPIEISIVIPVYNEVDNLESLQAEIDASLVAFAGRYEIVYVNDGSSDGSSDKLAEICSAHPEAVSIDLRRNFGQTAAIAAGLDHSRGDIVVTLDADLQNPPSDIGLLIDKLHEGYDVVSGWRRERKDTFLTRRVPSAVANGLISVVCGVHLHDYGCTLKAYRREVIDEIKLYGEMHRFIPVFAAAAGARIAEVVVSHRPRIHGKAKYGLMRTFKVILDLVTVKFLLSYRTTPMYLFGGVGFSLIALGFLALLLALVRKIFYGVSLILTPLPLLSAILFALGMQSVLLGLTTELLVRTYYEAQDKPIYVVRQIHKERKHK